jgi:tetratricopeptide (TPR) repeat protein
MQNQMIRQRLLEMIVKPDAMLYADELSWLYNELGLAAYVQGALHDAYALFRSGQDINRVAERRINGQRWLQSEINLALVELERARLSQARYHLENALSVAQKNQDAEVEARASGYLALVHHLSGNYTLAERLYRKVIKMSIKFGNFRGVSLFSWHSSDLQRLLGRLEEANRQINESIAAAESDRHPDLLHYARVAAVNLKRSSPGESKAAWATTGFLGSALDFAQKAGILKLKADVYRVQILIALDQGETQLAGRLAMRCLGIASLSGMACV